MTKLNFSPKKIILSVTKIIFSPTNIILVPLKIQTFESNGTSNNSTALHSIAITKVYHSKVKDEPCTIMRVSLGCN